MKRLNRRTAITLVLVAGFLADKELDEVFAMGIASATACIMTEGTIPLEKAQYKSLIGQVQVRQA